MKEDQLKLIFVPWGATDYGDDVWLLENALVFCLESIVEILPPVGSAHYADLYSQLHGDKVRSAPQSAYTEAELRELAARAPTDVDAIVDGLITVSRDPDTDALLSVTIAPRILVLPAGRIELPDAFVFEGFAAHRQARSEWHVSDQTAFFELASALAETVLATVGAEVPSYINANRLVITESWEAFTDFIKAKRLARTFEEKCGYYRQARRHDPRFFWALFNEGQLLKGQRDFAGARKLFMEAVSAARADPALLGDTYFEIGLCSVSLGDPKTARNFWDQALTFAPDNPSLLINIAGTFEQEADFERAISLSEKVLEIDPRNHKALVGLGRLQATLGNIDEAIGYYRRALDMNPDDALRQAILGGCYVAKGDYESAREHLEIASRLDPPRAELGVVTGSDAADDVPVPGEYARQELVKLDLFRSKSAPKPRGFFSKAKMDRRPSSDS